MTIVLPFGPRRRLSVKVGRRLAYINWSRRTGRDMWLTAADIILWDRWS
jgi:hypothetical protein